MNKLNFHHGINEFGETEDGGLDIILMALGSAKVIAAAKLAKENMSLESVEAEGLLLGGRLTIKIEFDERPKDDPSNFELGIDVRRIRASEGGLSFAQKGEVMPSHYHIALTIRDKSPKGFHRQWYGERHFADRDVAITAAYDAFQQTPGILFVEVFESGVARPIKTFELGVDANHQAAFAAKIDIS